MANPNIVNVTAIYGTTTYFVPTGTTAVILLPNAASSGLVYKIENVVVSNAHTAAVDATVGIYSNGSVAQGSPPAGGTAYHIAYQISVPPKSSLIAVDKSTSFYLMEGTSIYITAGVANVLHFVVSYENISSS
jgi:hypothetical protein